MPVLPPVNTCRVGTSNFCLKLLESYFPVFFFRSYCLKQVSIQNFFTLDFFMRNRYLLIPSERKGLLNGRDMFHFKAGLHLCSSFSSYFFSSHNFLQFRLDSIDPGKYNFERPSYIDMISDFLPKEENEVVSYLPPFPVWLNVTIRAIFDSKYNEILLSYNKGKKISRFPDFVYSWLGTFFVDKESKRVKRLDYMNKEEVARESRCNLLYGLKAASDSKLWEITVFHDFLTEALSLDELVFFLHCRFILFKGPQMAIPTAGYCVTHFVTKERVVDTIDRIMYKYSLDDRKDLRSKLIEFAKSTYKDSNAFDYAMVLRILLEFYRKEKKENFARFEELYINTKKHYPKKATTTGNAALSFDSFYQIMVGEYDKTISDQEVFSLYREAYIAGGTSINVNSLLVSFSDGSFWTRYLRLKGQNQDPKYDMRGDIDQSDEKGKECASVYSDWEQNEEFLTKIRKYLIECGLPEYLQYFDNLDNYIRYKGKVDSAIYSGKSMLQVYRLLWLEIFELWTINEEKIQFFTDPDYKHDPSREFGIFLQLKELFLSKIDKISNIDEKKTSTYKFEQNFAKATAGTDILSRIHQKIREEDSTPVHKKDSHAVIKSDPPT